MDGFSATTALREREGRQGRRVPIIALTASVFAEERSACLEAGMDDVLSKPVTSEDIASIIDNHLH